MVHWPDRTRTERTEEHTGGNGGCLGPQHLARKAHRSDPSVCLLVAPTSLGADGDDLFATSERWAPDCPKRHRRTLGDEVIDPQWTFDDRQPDPTGLTGRLSSDAAPPFERSFSGLGPPPHRCSVRDQRHDAIHAELGQLGHRPVGAIALDRGEGHRRRRPAPLFNDVLADREDITLGHLTEAP